MTCAKREVFCKIAKDGLMVLGSNWCENPQEVCPREEGEDYTKCKTICKQHGHAEEHAIELAIAAGIIEGSTATLYGHSYYCRKCQEELFDVGVKYLARGD